MLTGARTRMVADPVAVFRSASVTVAAKEKIPGVVGARLSWPVTESKATPLGSVPLETAQL